jgi:hypothetical protein
MGMAVNVGFGPFGLRAEKLQYMYCNNFNRLDFISIFYFL